MNPLLRLLARVLVGPEPDETTFGDAEAREARTRLARGDHTGADALLAPVRDPSERTFYLYVLTRGEGRPPVLDAWCDRAPDHAAAWLLRGAHGVRWAWDARGAGVASTVSDRGAGLFVERLERARGDLERAAALDPTDPLPWAWLVTVGRGLQERGLADEAFRQACRRDRWNRHAHAQMLQTVCAKWLGSDDEMFELARRVDRDAPDGCPARVVLAHAHIENGVGHEYFRDPAVRDELLAAYGRSLGSPAYVEHKQTFRDANDFAYAFSRTGDLALARELFARIDGRVTAQPWGSVRAFERARRAAG